MDLDAIPDYLLWLLFTLVVIDILRRCSFESLVSRLRAIYPSIRNRFVAPKCHQNVTTLTISFRTISAKNRSPFASSSSFISDYERDDNNSLRPNRFAFWRHRSSSDMITISPRSIDSNATAIGEKLMQKYPNLTTLIVNLDCDANNCSAMFDIFSRYRAQLHTIRVHLFSRAKRSDEVPKHDDDNSISTAGTIQTCHTNTINDNIPFATNPGCALLRRLTIDATINDYIDPQVTQIGTRIQCYFRPILSQLEQLYFASPLSSGNVWVDAFRDISQRNKFERLGFANERNRGSIVDQLAADLQAKIVELHFNGTGFDHQDAMLTRISTRFPALTHLTLSLKLFWPARLFDSLSRLPSLEYLELDMLDFGKINFAQQLEPLDRSQLPPLRSLRTLTIIGHFADHRTFECSSLVALFPALVELRAIYGELDCDCDCDRAISTRNGLRDAIRRFVHERCVTKCHDSLKRPWLTQFGRKLSIIVRPIDRII